MKKIFNFFVQLLAVCGFVAGLYYLYKKYIFKDTTTSDEEEDSFDDFEFDDEDFTETVSDSREYVTLNSSESKAMPKAQTPSEDGDEQNEFDD